MAKEIGIGLVGYGGIGRVHALCYRMLPLVYPHLPVQARIAAVATASTASAERAHRELGDIATTTDLQALLDLADVAVVDCCTPTDDHMRVASAALASGRALFCEKPLAATASDATAIAALAWQRNLTGGVNYHFRWIPALQEAHRRIQAGDLGEIYSFHLRYYRSSNLRRDRPLTWRFAGPGSGVLLDLGSHLLDLVEHLLGPITTVAAHSRTVITERPDAKGAVVPVTSDDVVWLQVELANGARGSLEASKVVPGAADDLRIEAYGSRGACVFDTRDPNSLYLASGEDSAIGGQWVATLNRTSPASSIPGAETPTGLVQWHLASIAAFLHALGTSTRPQPDLHDAARVQAVIDAAFRSLAQGGAAIAVNPV